MFSLSFFSFPIIYQALHKWLAIMEFKEHHHEMLLGNDKSTMKKLFIIPASIPEPVHKHSAYTLAGIILDVPLVLQKLELSRGCEVASLAMVLRLAGVTVDKMTLAREIKSPI
jgi:hypothetical protein